MMSNFLRRAIPLCYTYDKTVKEEYVSRAEDAVKMPLYPNRTVRNRVAS